VSDLDRQIETLVALREATREAREAAKDLRAEMKAAREARAEFFATPELDARLVELLTDAALARYSDSISEHIEKATAAVYNRFDTITMICMGEDPVSVREGKRTVPDLIREFIAAKNLPYRLALIRENGSAPAGAAGEDGEHG
jgi:hypothetical protein